MPTHGHGHGYADANFLVPELISAVQFKKGPYFADEGDFASAGAMNVNYVSLLERPIALVQSGSNGFGRALVAASPRVGDGFVLFALEAGKNDGPWVRPDDFRKFNGVLRYTRGDQRGGFSITAMGYDARWNATDQIPARAVGSGLSRFGLVDATDGGTTSRYSLSSEWQRSSSTALTQAGAYAIRYRLDLFSNFTYFLDDPVNGDQFEQVDDRFVAGMRASHRWISKWRGITTENVAGVQIRHDDIRIVGLYHTRERSRLSTTREDSLAETSSGVYLQSAMQWRPVLRTVVGLRGDRRTTATLLSPKLSLIFGPWRNTELYANAGSGFHSNDARGGTPLVRTRGAEIGVRTKPASNVHLTAALWGLDLASELLFVGDAGTTEASGPSRRAGLEVAAFCDVRDWLTIDTEYAYSRARFRNRDRIPGAVEGVASLGLTLGGDRRASGELRYRYFGPRPLIEDDSVRSQSSSLVNGMKTSAVDILKISSPFTFASATGSAIVFGLSCCSIYFCKPNALTRSTSPGRAPKPRRLST
jgi:hypothetical protein